MARRVYSPSTRRTRSEPDRLRRIVAEVRERQRGYRARSLALYGWICARCAREFDSANLHQLTVHHRDGNPRNNPPDGSNWENLCTECHTAEHSKDVLADYLAGQGDDC